MLEKLQKLLLICLPRCSASRLNWSYIIIYLASPLYPSLYSAAQVINPGWQHIFFPFYSACNGISRLMLFCASLHTHKLPDSCGLAGNVPQPAGSWLWLPVSWRCLPWQRWQDPPRPACLQFSQGGMNASSKLVAIFFFFFLNKVKYAV